MGKRLCFMTILLILIPINLFSQVDYDVEKKLLSVKSEGRLMKEILSEVSAKTGIDIYISPAVDKKVFADIERQPVEDAIKIIIKPFNNAIVFLGNSIKSVKIYEKSEAEATLEITPSVISETTSPPIDQVLDFSETETTPPPPIDQVLDFSETETTPPPIDQVLDENILTKEEGSETIAPIPPN